MLSLFCGNQTTENPIVWLYGLYNCELGADRDISSHIRTLNGLLDFIVEMVEILLLDVPLVLGRLLGNSTLVTM
jgi:hypothetical protein